MLSVSDLSAEQIEAIKSWVSEGAQMADVQKRLKEDFGFNVTYMDTRFLSLDLELEYEVEAEPEESKEVEVLPPAPVPTGEVVASVDQVARPGCMVSGKVTFSDGMNGAWMIDEMGRPSVDPDQAGYQPTEADMLAFQTKLRSLLERQ